MQTKIKNRICRDRSVSCGQSNDQISNQSPRLTKRNAMGNLLFHLGCITSSSSSSWVQIPNRAYAPLRAAPWGIQQRLHWRRRHGHFSKTAAIVCWKTSSRARARGANQQSTPRKVRFRPGLRIHYKEALSVLIGYL